MLAACAGQDERHSTTSYEAIAAYERGTIVVVDVRSERERGADIPKIAMPHIQFGPDTWSGAPIDDPRAFVARVRAVAADDRPVALLCQAGVRSQAAAAVLQMHSIKAINIRDGYLGNRHGPGWRAWE